MQHAADSWIAAGMIALWALLIVRFVRVAQKGKNYFIRRIPGLNAIDEALGRATEMGRPIIMCPGQNDVKDSISPIQALAIFSYIIKTAAKFGNRVMLPCSASGVYTIAQEVVRDSYAAAGRPDLYHPDIVTFISDRQFAYASGVAGMIYREKVAASFLFGDFYAESLIFGESGQAVGAIQVAGTIQTTQIPFFIAACDYTIIGDEFYAATAYISREPTLLGSLVAQDICKGLMILMVIIGAICLTLQGTDAQFVKWFAP